MGSGSTVRRRLACCIIRVKEELRRITLQRLGSTRLAAAQQYDMAQNWLGFMHGVGHGVAKDYSEALRMYKLAAAQGYGWALYNVGQCYESGWSVAADRTEAIRWYKRAAAAGWSSAADKLKALGA